MFGDKINETLKQYARLFYFRILSICNKLIYNCCFNIKNFYMKKIYVFQKNFIFKANGEPHMASVQL